jgi:hypothetical protein
VTRDELEPRPSGSGPDPRASASGFFASDVGPLAHARGSKCCCLYQARVSTDLERRIAERIADGYCQIGKAPIEIFEDAKEGQARVTCAFSAAGVGLWLRLDKVGFPFLRRQKSVDWLVLVHLPAGSMDAHLIECKTTMGSKQWLEVKDQMSSSVVRALALAGALEVQIRRFFCYTAYRHDRLSIRRSPDPFLMRQPLGSCAEPAETRRARTGQLDWEADEIRLDGVGTPIPHRRVPLDPDMGTGQAELLAG